MFLGGAHHHGQPDVHDVHHAVRQQLLGSVHEKKFEDPPRSLVVVLHSSKEATFDGQEDEND